MNKVHAAFSIGLAITHDDKATIKVSNIQQQRKVPYQQRILETDTKDDLAIDLEVVIEIRRQGKEHLKHLQPPAPQYMETPVRRMQLRTIDNVMRAIRATGRPGGAARPGRF